MKRLLIAAAVLLFLQAACSLPAALSASIPAQLTETAAAPGQASGQEVNGADPATPAAAIATPAPGQATAAPAVPVPTTDPRVTFLLSQLRLYLATNPHIHKVDELALAGSVLDLQITTIDPGQTDQAGVAYETAKAIAGGLSLAPKDQVDHLMKSGQGSLHLQVNSSDGAWHFTSDSPLALLAGLQAGQVSQDAWMAGSHYKPAP